MVGWLDLLKLVHDANDSSLIVPQIGWNLSYDTANFGESYIHDGSVSILRATPRDQTEENVKVSKVTTVDVVIFTFLILILAISVTCASRN